jgi:hypothetical protein
MRVRIPLEHLLREISYKLTLEDPRLDRSIVSSLVPSLSWARAALGGEVLTTCDKNGQFSMVIRSEVRQLGDPQQQ